MDGRGEKRALPADESDLTLPPKVQVVVGSGPPSSAISKRTESHKTDKPKNVGSPGDEFELTADMMVNDFDDERTLDEEEALEEADDQQNELSNLEKEKDMPMEDLLAMYGYAGDDEENESSKSSTSEEVDVSEESTSKKLTTCDTSHLPEGHEESKCDEIREKVDESPENCLMEVEKQPSLLNELYKDDSSSIAVGSRHLRSGSRQHSEDEEEEEEEDGEYSPEEDEWKKTIMVGGDYQAVIPEGLSKYDGAMPYENEDKLLWDPSSVDEATVVNYLAAVQDLQTSGNEINSIPRGMHIRDDEQALYLLHQCGNNVEEALRRQRINTSSPNTNKSIWSEEECRNFETGLRQFGKDFYAIHQNRVRTRSVGELVQFYYLWKKTERHDVFANKSRLEKKKYTLHPGTTDFMERYLDEQDTPIATPNCHSLLAGDPKRYARTPPPFLNPDAESMNHVEARIISSRFEDLSKHLDKDDVQSLVRLSGTSVLKPSNGMSSTSSEPSTAACSNDCVSTPFQPSSSDGRTTQTGSQ